MKTYARAAEDVAEMIAAVIDEYHEALKDAGVTIDLVMASADDGGPAVSLGGYACDAVVRIIGKKDRAKGHADAEITFDAQRWDACSIKERVALCDHELHHLIVQMDEGSVKTDDLGRPLLKMRKHDVQIGWFRDVALRNGIHSAEQRQAELIFTNYQQAFFPFVEETKIAAFPQPAKKQKAK